VFIVGEARVYAFRRKRLLPLAAADAPTEQPRLL
jgi:hypothetical protein